MGQVTASRHGRTHLASVGADVEGERFEASERLVIAPRAGVFEPQHALQAGSTIAAGQVVGHLTSGAERTPVVSPFSGKTGAPLALAGERLTTHQPVMWLSVTSSFTP